MKNFIILGLLCFSSLTCASENDKEQLIKKSQEKIVGLEKQEKFFSSTTGTSAIAFSLFGCAKLYKPKSSTTMPMLISCLKNRAMLPLSVAVGLISLVKWKSAEQQRYECYTTIAKTKNPEKYVPQVPEHITNTSDYDDIRPIAGIDCYGSETLNDHHVGQGW